MATITTDALGHPALLRLLQLSSVSLPVGGFAFSQGLETAVDLGWVHNRESTRTFLADQLHHALARVDLPVLARCHASADDTDALLSWNDWVLACRETRELRFTDIAMGRALIRLLGNLDLAPPFTAQDDVSFVTAFAFAAARWQVPVDSAALGFAWAWLENQVAAATKLVPLGQTDAQYLLGDLNPALTDAWAAAQTRPDDAIGACLPALAIASCHHETQYTRLFRS